jgi:hypothetical protein
MKRYFLAGTTTSKYIGLCTTEVIAAMLNSNQIRDDYVAAERTSTCPSYVQLRKSADAKWVTVAELLAAAYKNEPVITVVLKDVKNNTFPLSERYHSEDGPWQVAVGAVEDYFDQHAKEYSHTSMKEFQIFYMSDTCPPTVMDFKLSLEHHTTYEIVIDYSEDPAERPCFYSFDENRCRKVVSPDEFPSVALELKPPKYDPTAPLPRGWDDTTSHFKSGQARSNQNCPL